MTEQVALFFICPIKEHKLMDLLNAWFKSSLLSSEICKQ